MISDQLKQELKEILTEDNLFLEENEVELIGKDILTYFEILIRNNEIDKE